MLGGGADGVEGRCVGRAGQENVVVRWAYLTGGLGKDIRDACYGSIPCSRKVLSRRLCDA